jgi:hypothetical protein
MNILPDWSKSFRPVVEEKREWLIKFSELFVEIKGLRAIVPVVTVEEGHPQSYYVRITAHNAENRISVRLDPSTDPIKTRGVKRSIALLAETLQLDFPSLKIEHHNLQNYLETIADSQVVS